MQKSEKSEFLVYKITLFFTELLHSSLVIYFLTEFRMILVTIEVQYWLEGAYFKIF